MLLGQNKHNTHRFGKKIYFQICDPDSPIETDEIFGEILGEVSRQVSSRRNLKEGQQKSKEFIEGLIQAFVSLGTKIGIQ